MDLTRLAVDAGQFINRAVQYTGEALGQTERTEFGSRLEELLAQAESTKTWTDQIISQTEVLLQPSPGARLEDRLYEQLDWSAPPRPRVHEVLGDNMSQAGLELGPNTPYGTALLRCGETQKQIGEAERKFVQSTNIHFLTPLRSFTEGEYRVIQDERRTLLNKRLDLDIAKTRLRKAHEADAEARNLNANPLDDNYVAHVSYMFSFLRVKWLKIWAQEISQAEMELRICQSLFDRQSEMTGRLLEGLSTTHTNHMRSLTDFVEAQACYFAQCHQHAQELQKQLASIPSVLCSNNWQSGITNAINEPSISSHIANDPIGLNQVTPAPIVIHQLPGFNQAPPTANPLSGTEKASATTQLPDQTNINNNNNTSLADSQAPSWSSSTNGETSQSFTTKRSSGSWPPAETQAADQIFTSRSDNHSSAVRPADQLPAPSRTVSTLLTTSGGAVEPAASSGTGSQPTTSGATSPPSQLSGMVSKPQAANDTARETQESNIMTSETQTTKPTASETQTTNSKTGETQQTNGTASEIQRTNSLTSEATSDTANKTQTTSSIVSESQTTNDTANETQTINDTANETHTTNDTANETQTTNDTANETHTINDTVNETQTISNTVNETQTTSSRANEIPTTDDTANKTHTINDTDNETQTISNTVNETQTTSGRANEIQTTNDTANDTQTTNDRANKTHTTNETANETGTTGANETQTTSGTVSMTETTTGTASENLTTNGSARETLATSEAAADSPATN